MSLFQLLEFTSGRYISWYGTDTKYRQELEKRPISFKKVEMDFSDLYIKAGFLEHFLIPLHEDQGEAVLNRLFFY